MARIHIELDTTTPDDLAMLQRMIGDATSGQEPRRHRQLVDRVLPSERDEEDDAPPQEEELPLDAADNDGLTETVEELEAHDADEPSQAPVQGKPEQPEGRTTSPYGFADPNREPGKPRPGKSRRNSDEVAEDEAYFAGQSEGPAPEPQQAAQEPQEPAAVQEPQQAAPVQEEPAQAPQATAPAPGPSPFNF